CAFPPVPPAKTHSYYGSAFVTEMGSDGSGLIYSTYLGGTVQDGANAIAIDSDGSAYVTGGTNSIDFPTTLGAFQFVSPAKSATDAGSAFWDNLTNTSS